jgi:hypothetical protein
VKMLYFGTLVHNTGHDMNYRDYDCGLITTYKSSYTEHENKQRNKQLLAKIEMAKYSVTTLNSAGYDKFFVVDFKNIGKLGYDLTVWTKEYEQQWLVFMPAGMVDVVRILSPVEYQEFKQKEGTIHNYFESANIMGKMATKHIANSDWKDINV